LATPDADSAQPDDPVGFSSPGGEVSLDAPVTVDTVPFLREFAALLLLVTLCDLTWYRSVGFAGPAVMFLVAPLLFLLGRKTLRYDVSICLLPPLLIALSTRMIWCGSHLALVCGFVLLTCFGVSLGGVRPYLTRATEFAARTFVAGGERLAPYFQMISRFTPAFIKSDVFAARILLPAVVLCVFGSIFVLANPDVVTFIEKMLEDAWKYLEQELTNLEFTEVFFCLVVAWVGLGILRPTKDFSGDLDEWLEDATEQKNSSMYEAYRNTLIVVIALFAVYLVFEFHTLWFKQFPAGFHYSGYAHQGAAWLTIALALATIILSLIFRDSVLHDPRLEQLKRLSWIWSVENLLLSISVFNRLFIYIGFNGMTRMRVVGMLGVASVIGGLVLVLRKIAKQHDFLWLIRHQLWTVAFAVYLYAVLPVDGFVNRYNVDQILAGNLRPSVQISVHPTSDEGYLCLKPLINCQDVIIRDGVRSMLDQKLNEMEFAATKPGSQHWTATQFAARQLQDQLEAAKSLWENDGNRLLRDTLRQKFNDYAYQWY